MVGEQLGIPVFVMGIIVAICFLMVVLMKPVLAALADAFPSCRRLIFLMTLGVMVLSFSFLNFVPPMKGRPRLQGRLGRQLQNTSESSHAMTPVPLMEEDSLLGEGSDAGSSLLLVASDNGECVYIFT